MSVHALQQVEPTVNVEIITASTAREYLKMNVRNRALRKGHVRKMVVDMRSGEWEFNGDAIRFDNDGVLRDGQHRLQAVVESGQAQEFVVVRGLEPEVCRTIDIGQKRTLGDHLKLNGVRNFNIVAGSANVLIAFKQGTLNHSRQVSQMQQLAVVTAHLDGLSRSATRTSVVPKRLVPHTILAPIHYVGTHLTDHVERAEAFVKVFETGIPDYPGCAAHVWRERVLREAARHNKIERSVRLWTTVDCWSKFIKKVPIQTIHLKTKGKMPGLNPQKI